MQVATFKNEQYQMQSFVTTGSYGFHVSLQDLDSGEFVGLVTCFKEEEKAVNHAKKLVA
jgi:hypothetical protein